MAKKSQPFDLETFLSSVDGGRTISRYRKDESVFVQGDPADAVFYIRKGECKVTVVSQQGKEAVVALHGKGDFFGEGCLNGHTRRLATVTAITPCEIMRLDKPAILRVLHDHPNFPSFSFRTWLPERCVLKRTWSISSSIPARSVWRGSSY
jgi:CRP/FNR family transcriptional regulator, cyclic AMP receptor protein